MYGVNVKSHIISHKEDCVWTYQQNKLRDTLIKEISSIYQVSQWNWNRKNLFKGKICKKKKYRKKMEW